MNPTVFVLSGSMGAGKGLLQEVLTERGVLRKRPISATTRTPRKGERQGREYYFVSEEQFLRWADAGVFAEWANNHGNLYGTLNTEVWRLLAENQLVLLEIDVKGGLQLREREDELGIQVVLMWLEVPEEVRLQRVLRDTRRNHTPDDLLRRQETAVSEDVLKREYDFEVPNDGDIDEAADMVMEIIHARRTPQPA